MSEATGRASKLERETREAEETNREASAELSRLRVRVQLIGHL